MPAYIERSDCLLTPILPDTIYSQEELEELEKFDNQSVLNKVTKSMFSLDREMLIKHKHATDLFCRGWIRVEEVLGSNMPTHDHQFGWFKRKGVPHRKDRPHFFCTPELLPENFLLLLPKLQNTTLRSLRPEDGLLTYENDRNAIKMLMKKMDLDDSVKYGYKGPGNDCGKPHGNYGEQTMEDGEKYKGPFQHGKRHGKNGKLYFPTGDWYFGDFENNKMHGKGIFYFADGDRYVGEFQNGKHSGHGTMYYSWGDVHVGIWFDDSENGYGITTFPNGDIYEGEYLNGHRHGAGIYKIALCSVKYEGKWRSRKKNGEGIWSWSKLNIEKSFVVIYEDDELRFFSSFCAQSGFLEKIDFIKYYRYIKAFKTI